MSHRFRARVDLIREARLHVVFLELALQWIRVRRTTGQILRVVNAPHTVVLQSPERILGVMTLPRGTELLQQFGHVFVDIPKLHPSAAPLHLRQRVQHEKRLVRRPLVSATPDGQIFESAEDRRSVHACTRDEI